VEHHPRQGDSAIRLVGFDRIAARPELAQILGLPAAEELLLATAQPVAPLTELVDLWEGDDLPVVADLNPYRLGATPTDYGDKTSYGQHDPYVPRTSNDVDLRLSAALEPGRLVLLVGPSKAGKTRTAFEAVKDRWPQARLLAPRPATLQSLVAHPRLMATSDALVVWLDELQRFLTIKDPLTLAMLTGLNGRHGPTVVLATLGVNERARLVRDTGELTWDTRLLLENADFTIDLAPTSDDTREQAVAKAAYPDADLSAAGLAEQLAGAPALLQQYHDAQYADPLLHAVLQSAVDWTRTGMPRPTLTDELSGLALDVLLDRQPELEPTDQQLEQAIKNASTPPRGAGRVAGLRTARTAGRSRSYRPFSYLVAADDGQSGSPRPIPPTFWDRVLRLANPDEAFDVGFAAYQRNNIGAAISAFRKPAAAGYTRAMVNLGILLSDWLYPPELAEARRWYEQAAAAGDTRAMFNLGTLLADRLKQPELARRSYEQAAAAGHINAMVNLGNLLSDLGRPELARRWYEKAAAAGDTDAMVNLGLLLSDLDQPELAEACYWFEKAAAAGDADAMNNLGALLVTRLDPPQLDQARFWYERAAAGGHTAARANLRALSTGLPGQKDGVP
jgi:TPR repeat protein